MTLQEFINGLQRYPARMEVFMLEVPHLDGQPRWRGTIAIGQYLVDNPSGNLIGIFDQKSREMIWATPKKFKLLGEQP